MNVIALHKNNSIKIVLENTGYIFGWNVSAPDVFQNNNQNVDACPNKLIHI